MSMHLFSTPVECRECGATVSDPKVDRCPNCGALLKERRTPGRLAGVEQRYGQIRFLVGMLRFLGIAVLLVGGLVILFAAGEVPVTTVLTTSLAVLVVAVVMFAVAAFFTVALDIEENTRAAFRIQQLRLEHERGEKRPEVAAPPDVERTEGGD